MSILAQLQIAQAMFLQWLGETFGQGMKFPPVVGMPEADKVWVK